MNNIITFDYKMADLIRLKDYALETDKENKKDLEEVKKSLVKVRNSIKKQGKAYRDEANAYNKSVIAKEKEYLVVIAESEDMITSAIEKLAKRDELEMNKTLLPYRKEEVAKLKFTQENITEDFLLNISSKDWAGYYMGLVEYNDKCERAHNISFEREAKIREDEKSKIEEKTKRVKEDQEAKQKEEAESLAKNTEYLAFLKNNKYNKETDIVRKEDEGVTIYRKLATLKF